MAYGYPSSYRRRKRRRYVPRSIGRFRGRGSYMGELGRNILVGGGTALGGYLGGGPVNPYGAVLGAGFGGTAGSAIADALGMGAYNVASNSLVVPEGSQIPAFGDLGDAVIIKHREYIADVVVPAVPAAFTNTTFILNPGVANSFPWLSTVAQSFDSYMWLGMIFEFRSTSADIGSVATLGMGSVIMATDYDAKDAPASSKLQMENMQFSTSAKPSETFLHCVECDPSVNVQPHLFVRTGAVAATDDVRFFDHGNFQIATQGLPTGSSGTLGELWCSYQVALFKPQINLGNGLLTDVFVSATATNSSYWGSNATRSANSSLGCSIVNNTLFLPGASSFPPQPAKIGTCYLITLSVTGSSTVLTNNWGFIPADCVPTLFELQSPGITTTRQWFMMKVIITGNNPNIQLISATIPGSPTKAIAIVTQIDTDVFPDIV